MLPKLKLRYTKKFSEVEASFCATRRHVPTSLFEPQEQKRAAAIPSTSPPPPQGPEHNYSLSNSRSNPSIPSRPVVTAPQPLRALDRRPSGSAPTGRNRSPSSSTAFSDLAHQGGLFLLSCNSNGDELLFTREKTVEPTDRVSGQGRGEGRSWRAGKSSPAHSSRQKRGG